MNIPEPIIIPTIRDTQLISLRFFLSSILSPVFVESPILKSNATLKTKCNVENLI